MFTLFAIKFGDLADSFDFIFVHIISFDFRSFYVTKIEITN